MIERKKTSGDRKVLSVTQLNRDAKRLLEGQFGQVWVQGELSNLARPQSGHWYFSLKDSKAQIRCAMFRNRNSLLRFKPQEGQEVIARGRISLYEGRGDFQMIVDNLQPAGEGAMQAELERLRQKLAKEGLFDEHDKQALPEQAQHIAIVSSASGAALQDILTVFARRAPQILLSLYPVQVQGDAAPGQLRHAVDALSRAGDDMTPPLDAIILARGGGSLEDLWAFNDEALARAIAASPIPIVSAVGHETDFSISDWVADCRAPTPSAAAELLSPDTSSILSDIQHQRQRLIRAMAMLLQRSGKDLAQLRRLLRHPGQRLEEHHQRCDELSGRLLSSMQSRLKQAELTLQMQQSELRRNSPESRLEVAQLRVKQLQDRLLPAQQHQLKLASNQFNSHMRLLNTVSPLATLQRGYAIVETQSGQIVRRSDDVSSGDRITARLGSGEVSAIVD